MTQPVNVHTLKAATRWTSNLAKLCRYKTGRLTEDEREDWKEELALYATMLAKWFPAEAFTTDSLQACVAAYFPPIDTIRQQLTDWWETNAPVIVTRLSGPDSDLPVKDRTWLNLYRRRHAEITGANYRPIRATVADDLANLVSLIRQNSPAAWAKVSGNEERGTVQLTDEQRDQVLARFRSKRGDRAA